MSDEQHIADLELENASLVEQVDSLTDEFGPPKKTKKKIIKEQSLEINRLNTEVSNLREDNKQLRELCQAYQDTDNTEFTKLAEMLHCDLKDDGYAAHRTVGDVDTSVRITVKATT